MALLSAEELIKLLQQAPPAPVEQEYVDNMPKLIPPGAFIDNMPKLSGPPMIDNMPKLKR